jgi:LCP family protein required for cell wall assembly
MLVYSLKMVKKIILGILVVGGLASILYVGINTYLIFQGKEPDVTAPVKELLERTEEIVEREKRFPPTINILLVGVDTSTGRRTRGQAGFNTDTMILLSINTETNRVLLTSVPRDLWINGNKINALYIVYGEDNLVDAFEKVTGQEVQGVVRVDFDHFMWLVDAFGGVPVTVERTFTDYSFPNASDSGATTVTFVEGSETMDGSRALTFARSRKGNNGEGSDLMRAKRQHLLLQGMVEAISQPKSMFQPMVVEKFFKTIIDRGITTTLVLEDVKYLWDFYKDRDLYEVESFVVDGTYVYHPGMYPDSAYKAWVFVPREPGFANLHADITAKLDGTFVTEEEKAAMEAEKTKEESAAKNETPSE